MIRFNIPIAIGMKSLEQTCCSTFQKVQPAFLRVGFSQWQLGKGCIEKYFTTQAVIDTISYSDCYRNEITRTDLLLNVSKVQPAFLRVGFSQWQLGKDCIEKYFIAQAVLDTISKH